MIAMGKAGDLPAGAARLSDSEVQLMVLRRYRDDLIGLVQATNRHIEALEAAGLGPQGAELDAFIAARALVAGVPVALILGPRRDARLARLRQAIMSEAEARGHSLAAIGRALGNRDSSTIAHGVRAHRARADRAGREVVA